jgi:membrane protease YdiL (CAAX protease family)
MDVVSANVDLDWFVGAAIAYALCLTPWRSNATNLAFNPIAMVLIGAMAVGSGSFVGEWWVKNLSPVKSLLAIVYNAGVITFLSACVTALWLMCLEFANGHGLAIPIVRQSVVETMLGAGDQLERLRHAMSAIATAPLVEEIVFRGFLYKFLRGRTRPSVAAAVAAVAFAIMHCSVLAFPGMVIFGLCTVKIYERSGGILATVLVHSAFNAIGLATVVG